MLMRSQQFVNVRRVKSVNDMTNYLPHKTAFAGGSRRGMSTVPRTTVTGARVQSLVGTGLGAFVVPSLRTPRVGRLLRPLQAGFCQPIDVAMTAREADR